MKDDYIDDGGWAGLDYIEGEYHEIVPNLFLGSQPSSIDKFKYVFAMNGRPTYWIPVGKMVFCRPFHDCELVPDVEMLHDTAEMVLECSKKGPTLVHCMAGINRSSLIVGLALVKSGMAPKDAIALIREKRSKMCLSNETFAAWLLGLEGRSDD